MQRGKDRRSPANFAYDIMASEDLKHDHEEWRDLTPEVQTAFAKEVIRLIQRDLNNEGDD